MPVPTPPTRRRQWRSDGAVELYTDAAAAEAYAPSPTSPPSATAAWSAGAPSGSPAASPAPPVPASAVATAPGWPHWSRVCEVLEAVPGRSFVFRTVPERFDPTRRDSTTWSYTFTPEGPGVRVRHAYRITRMPLEPLKSLYGWLLPHHRDMRPQMSETLAALKEAVEGDR